ncbi:MAG TPA: hypothetical protein VHH09_03890 [Acidimicrobiales bacterium]|nr:hypothetical protein [Acidimicrobiales bacterium]
MRRATTDADHNHPARGHDDDLDPPGLPAAGWGSRSLSDDHSGPSEHDHGHQQQHVDDGSRGHDHAPPADDAAALPDHHDGHRTSHLDDEH